MGHFGYHDGSLQYGSDIDIRFIIFAIVLVVFVFIIIGITIVGSRHRFYDNRYYQSTPFLERGYKQHKRHVNTSLSIRGLPNTKTTNMDKSRVPSTGQKETETKRMLETTTTTTTQMPSPSVNINIASGKHVSSISSRGMSLQRRFAAAGNIHNLHNTRTTSPPQPFIRGGIKSSLTTRSTPRSITRATSGLGHKPSDRAHLLIGLNYTRHDTSIQLMGCHNDVTKTAPYVLGKIAPSDSVRTITDFDSPPPTRETLIQSFRWIASAQKKCVIIWYSGHGVRVNKLDEAIVPLDFRANGGRLIIDDELRDIIVGGTVGQNKITLCVWDCCHSGSMLDQPYDYRVNEAASAISESNAGSPFYALHPEDIARDTTFVGSNYQHQTFYHHPPGYPGNIDNNNTKYNHRNEDKYEFNDDDDDNWDDEEENEHSDEEHHRLIRGRQSKTNNGNTTKNGITHQPRVRGKVVVTPRATSSDVAKYSAMTTTTPALTTAPTTWTETARQYTKTAISTGYTIVERIRTKVAVAAAQYAVASGTALPLTDSKRTSASESPIVAHSVSESPSNPTTSLESSSNTLIDEKKTRALRDGQVVISLGACWENESDADQYVDGINCGALSEALKFVIDRYKGHLTWRQLLCGIRQRFVQHKLKQVPTLESNVRLDLNAYIEL